MIVSGTLAVTTTPQPVNAGPNAVSGRDVVVQVIGTGTVVLGGKVGVAAGNGVQISSVNGPYVVTRGGNDLMLSMLWAATLTGTATLMWTAN